MDGGSSGSPASSPLHVVICPWLAFGHLLPCLDLSQRLASQGHRVSYVSTPGNIARLPPVHPGAAPMLEFVALPFPRVEGLAEGEESTKDVPFEKVELLWKAFDGLAAPFAEFLGAACADEGRRPDWVIVDIFHHWAAAAALEYKVRKYFLHSDIDVALDMRFELTPVQSFLSERHDFRNARSSQIAQLGSADCLDISQTGSSSFFLGAMRNNSPELCKEYCCLE